MNTSSSGCSSEPPIYQPGPDRTHIEQLENHITELAAHIHAANFRLLELIGEFDACNGWSGPGMRSCAHWLNWKCGTNLGAAREKVRVARALPDLPRTSEAFRLGRISYSKVRAMTRVATPDNEEYLLMVARHGTASHVERVVRLYRKVGRIRALEKDKQRHAQQELSWYQDDDGFYVFRGRLAPEQGVLVTKALGAALEQLNEERKDVSAKTPDPAEMLHPNPEPMAHRKAEALVRMAESFTSGAAQTSCSGDRHLVHIHTDMESLKQDGTGAESELEGARNVSSETSRRLACDAGVVHWLENQQGETLNIGRKTRTVPPALRRALQRRDRGCRFPGCSCSRFVDAHHVKHWADGGETSLENLVLLCRYHHRLVHEGGFSVQLEAGQQIRFYYPDGNVLPDAAPTRFRGNVFQLLDKHRESGIHITPQTPIPDWYGERMDDGLAVLGLEQLE